MSVTTMDGPRAATGHNRNEFALVSTEALIEQATAGTDPDARQRWQTAYAARKACASCGQCARLLGSDEHVTLVRKNCGYNALGRYVAVKTPFCDVCAPKLAPWSHSGTCEGCKRPVTVHIGGLPVDPWKHDVYGTDRRRYYCSERCHRIAETRRRSEQRAAARENMSCRTCGDWFTPARGDAIYCSSACRQDAYRKRKQFG